MAARIKPAGDNYGGHAIKCSEWRCSKPAKFYEPEVSAYSADSASVLVTGPDRIEWIYEDEIEDRYELRQRVTLPGLRDNAVAFHLASWRWVCGIHARLAKVVKNSEQRRAAEARIAARSAQRVVAENIAEERRQREMELSAARLNVAAVACGLFADPSTATLADLRVAVEALVAARATYQP